MWSVMTTRLAGTETRVSQIHGIHVEWVKKNDQWRPVEQPGTEFTLPADVVLLAMGFVHVEHGPLVSGLSLELDARGNIQTQNYQTSNPMVFSAGDAMLGASLVVRAIDGGRQAAAAIDQWLRQ